MSNYRNNATGNYLTSSATESVVEHDSPLIRVETTTVATNVGTKQALLAAVPTGKVRIVTQVVARNASASLGAMSDGIAFGFNAGATNSLFIPFSGVVEIGDESYVFGWDAAANFNASGVVGKRGVAGEVYGCFFNDVSVTATLDIDVHYYDVDA